MYSTIAGRLSDAAVPLMLRDSMEVDGQKEVGHFFAFVYSRDYEVTKPRLVLAKILLFIATDGQCDLLESEPYTMVDARSMVSEVKERFFTGIYNEI